MDLIFTFLAILILSPFLILIIIVLFFSNSGKILFVQDRPGYLERSFTVMKFKTMSDQKDKNGNSLPDIQRLTVFGRLIRSFSLDELPQLYNILKGDMSLIGPRPLLSKYMPLYNEVQRRRHRVRPGITGWAQVNGRNSISWNEKFKYDVYYVDNLSFWLDCKILFLTIWKVLKREAVNQSEERPMKPFNGSN